MTVAEFREELTKGKKANEKEVDKGAAELRESLKAQKI